MNDYQKLYYHNQEEFLAYSKYNAKKKKKFGIVFLSGFKSDMNGTKAQAIEAHAKEKDYDFIKFDYFGHGKSSGEFINGTIGEWLKNAIFIIDSLTDDQPQILVGSSMGGWIMLLAALARPKKIAGLIGLAAAPDFTDDLIWNCLSKEQKAILEKDKFLHYSNDFCEDSYPITNDLIFEGRNHLLLNNPIKINVPVHLIHGMNDQDVPYQTSIKVAELLTSTNVQVQLLKTAGHRLSNPDELSIIYKAIDKFMNYSGFADES